MKISDDKKCLAAYQGWEDSRKEAAACQVDFEAMQAPDMTPIEQIVFFRLNQYEDGWKTTPQKQIGKYRVDFLVEGYYFEKPSRFSQIIIECDGHDFHERTKEQAGRDKKRDRELQALGFKVYRFTGSEIWKTDGRCVLESLGVDFPDQ